MSAVAEEKAAAISNWKRECWRGKRSINTLRKIATPLLAMTCPASLPLRFSPRPIASFLLRLQEVAKVPNRKKAVISKKLIQPPAAKRIAPNRAPRTAADGCNLFVSMLHAAPASSKTRKLMFCIETKRAVLKCGSR